MDVIKFPIRFAKCMLEHLESKYESDLFLTTNKVISIEKRDEIKNLKFIIDLLKIEIGGR